MPFLLDAGGGLLTIVVLFVFVIVGCAALASTRTLTRWTVAGVVIASFAYVILVASGTVGRWLPQFDSMGARWGMLGMLASSIILATIVIMRTCRATADTESE